MKPVILFLFLTAVAGWGQTTTLVLNPPCLGSNGELFQSTNNVIRPAGTPLPTCEWAKPAPPVEIDSIRLDIYVAEPSCDKIVYYGKSSKAIRDIFPKECGPIKFEHIHIEHAPDPLSRCHIERQTWFKADPVETHDWQTAYDLRIVCPPQKEK